MGRLRPLITTQEAARLLGLSVATVRRRAVEGILPSERTRGGHRRFRRSTIDALVEADQAPAPVRRRGYALLGVQGRLEAHAALLAARKARNSWWDVFDDLRLEIRDLHARCARGAISVVDWEVTLDRARWALCFVAESLTLRADAPLALVASVPEDRAGVADTVFQIGVSEFGWRCKPLVHVSPEELAEELAAAPIRAALISASGLVDRASLAELAPRYLRVARAAGVPLGCLGYGPWPVELDGIRVFAEGPPEEVGQWLDRARLAPVSRETGAPVPAPGLPPA